MVEKLLKDYNVRLNREAFLKALICGFIVGFVGMLISAAIFWFTDFKYIWLAFIALGVCAGIATPLFYYKRFCPSARTVARRIDDLGLEERMITMTQFKDDNSFIATRQRIDAEQALRKVDPKLLRIIVSVPLIVSLVCSFIGGAGMYTVAALSSAGFMSSGKDVLEEIITPPLPEYHIVYEVKGAGLIEGDIEQHVLQGHNAKGVLAIADDEWVFMEWSDGNTDPYREDKNVQGDITVTAIFAMAMDGFPGDGDGEEGDPNAPGDEEGDGKPGDGQNGQMGGEWLAHNQVVDGKTYYGGPTFNNAYEDVLDLLQQNEEIPDALKQLIDNYFKTIEQ